MIISPTSYLRTPPKILTPKQVLVFNGIQYSIDICDFAFARLTDNLYKFSFPQDKLVPAFPVLFSDAWTIINNATIFYKIVTNLFGIDKGDPIFEKIRGIELLRNSQQHVDERIDEVLLEKDLPIYGSLSWYAQIEPNSMNGKIITIESGTITHKKSIKSTGVNPMGKGNDKVINEIEFSMVANINKQYAIKTIKLNELMTDLNLIINHFERQLDDQLKMHEPLERHINDLIITMDTIKF
jgi:hypothetical protein